MRSDPLTRLVRGTLHDLAPEGVPGYRELVRTVLADALQGERPGTRGDATVTDPGDPGLCGPGSASWQVLDDVAGILAGVRALLLQTLHPLAMAGVADHSSYGEDPFGRLHRTSAWVAAASFGSTDEALAVSRIVRGQHRRVVGTAPDGRAYAASHPELLAWVSITFTESLLRADRVYAAKPVDDATADRFVLEQSRLSALLDPRVDLVPFEQDADARAALRRWELDLPLLDEGLLPTDVAGLRAARARYDHELVRGEQAQEALRFLRSPGLPAYALPPYRAVRLGAIATFEPRVRAMLGHAWLRGAAAAAARRQAGVLLTALRLGTGSSPARLHAERRVLAA